LRLPEANALLQDMITADYRAPIDALDAFGDLGGR